MQGPDIATLGNPMAQTGISRHVGFLLLGGDFGNIGVTYLYKGNGTEDGNYYMIAGYIFWCFVGNMGILFTGIFPHSLLYNSNTYPVIL